MSRLNSCTKGAVAVITAMVFPILLGFTSLGIEVGHWYLGVRQMQGAADAAAISAAVQLSADPENIAYQTTGQHYAGLNGYTIPIENVCLITAETDNCDPVRALDSRPIVCETPPCVVVQITQNTFEWLTTAASLKPTGPIGAVEPIPTPILKARSVVSLQAASETVTTAGSICILALANDPQAILIRGNGDLRSACGLAADGGRAQNIDGITPLGGIQFGGNNAKIHVAALKIAAASTECLPSPPNPPPAGSHCYKYEPATEALPASAIFTRATTLDPYADMVFPTPPQGVQRGGVALVTPGTGYTNGTRTFTVDGGTGDPAKFTATVSGGVVISISSVIDPGAYTDFSFGVVTATVDSGGGSGATFTLTQGCFTWVQGMIPIANRKYCSINATGAGTTNFPAGSYYVAGGDANCVGFCVSSGQASLTSDGAGVTFYLGKGEGEYGERYARINVTSGNMALCAPGTGGGTNCNTGGTGCSGSCMLFVQDRSAIESESQGTPDTTVNKIAGNGTRTLSGLIYLPAQTFAQTGNGPISGCFGVIAKYVDIGGTPSLTDGCLPGDGITTTIVTTTYSGPRLYQ